MATTLEVLTDKHGGIYTIAPDASVYEALEMMARENIGALPVVEHSKLRGIFSERDYARKVILQGKAARSTAVSELMTANVYTVTPDTGVDECMTLMTEHHIRHLPVLNRGRLVGLISIGDVVKTIIAEQQGQIQELHDYVSGNTY